MADTTIQWTDKTWNPVTGCTKVSPGCKHCYAETIAKRFWATQYPPIQIPTGDLRPRRFTDVLAHHDRLDQPLRWKKPARIFVNSMSDLFHEDVLEDFIAAVFGVIACTSRHTFQILTKRPARMRGWFTEWMPSKIAASRGVFPDDPYGWIARHLTTNRARHYGATANVQAIGETWPLLNCWLGVSVENQETADERIPLLLQTPAAVHFVSAEPLLGPVDLTPWLQCGGTRPGVDASGYEMTPGSSPRSLLDMVIVGGESGPNARACNLDWIRLSVDQCKAAGVPCFVKQLGRWHRCPHDPKGGHFDCFPPDLQLRQFPGVK